MISVSKLSGDNYEISVSSGTTTTHQIKVEPAIVENLTSGNADAEALLKKSFEFLLEREPNTSILRSFDLPIIGSYFPEYEAAMRKHFAGS
ncbi:MAG: hypothetical protein AAF591_11625 [Verrucomicrobiota bacterium]